MRPWSMNQRRALDQILALSIVLVLAASCAVLPPYRDYAGPERPDDQIAILKWAVSGFFGWVPRVSNIDGQQMPRHLGLFVKYPTEARLLPGKHIISHPVAVVAPVGMCQAFWDRLTSPTTATKRSNFRRASCQKCPERIL